MADITMCSGDGCPMKEKCYRHTAPVSEYRQAYFVKPPIQEDNTCEYFWDNDGKYNSREFDDV